MRTPAPMSPLPPEIFFSTEMKIWLPKAVHLLNGLRAGLPSHVQSSVSLARRSVSTTGHTVWAQARRAEIRVHSWLKTFLRMKEREPMTTFPGNLNRTDAGRPANWTRHLGNWKLFAAAGGACLAAGTNADAGIVYSGVLSDKTMSVAGNATFAGGSASAIIRTLNSSRLLAHLNISSSGNSLKASVYASKLKVNFQSSVIKKFDQSQPITNANMVSAGGILFSNRNGSQAGQFNPNGTGFIGFSLFSGELGWIKIKLENLGNKTTTNSFTIVSWAYNDVAGGSILAGQTAVPEPGTMAMGLLASGAAGVVALRRAKAKAAEAKAAMPAA